MTFRRDKITSRSGSPNRTLNSMTFGPLLWIIKPANKTPRKGVPLGFIGSKLARRSRA